MAKGSSAATAVAVNAVPLVDYFIQEDGVAFAGRHLFIDLWGASRLDDQQHIEEALCNAARAAGATILESRFHQFSDAGGVSGVLILAESHISIHTWPERDFAAIDVFMCGECNPHKSIPILKAAFQPDSVSVNESRRGLVT